MQKHMSIHLDTGLKTHTKIYIGKHLHLQTQMRKGSIQNHMHVQEHR